MLDATATWLRPVSWQWFVTYTFPWNVRFETGVARFRTAIQRMQADLRNTICFVAGMERLPQRGVPWHFHALLTAAVPIPQQLVRETWWKLVGRGNRTPAHPEGDSVEVSRYDDERVGPEYCLKRMNDCDGEWIHRRLELFNPNIPPSGSAHEDRLRRRVAAAREGANQSFEDM